MHRRSFLSLFAGLSITGCTSIERQDVVTVSYNYETAQRLSDGLFEHNVREGYEYILVSIECDEPVDLSKDDIGVDRGITRPTWKDENILQDGPIKSGYFIWICKLGRFEGLRPSRKLGDSHLKFVHDDSIEITAPYDW